MSRLTTRLAKLETRLGTGDSDKITIILRPIVDPRAPDETRHCRARVLGIGDIICLASSVVHRVSLFDSFFLRRE